MTELTLGLRIKVNADGSVQVLNQTGAGLDRVSNSAARANQQVQSLTRTVTAAATGMMAGFSVSRVIDEIGSFESKMISVKALTLANTADMKAMEMQARELGATTAFSAQQAAEAQGVLGSAGLKTNQILAATPDILQLAAAGQLDMARAAEIAIGTMRGMGMELTDLTRISDVAAKTAADTFSNVGDIGDAMKNAAPLARAFNIDLEDMSAAIGVLADNQIKGSEAGNNFKAMLAALGNETKEKTELLKQHGVTFADLNIQQRGLVPVMETLRKAHLSGAEAITLFGTDAAAAGLILSDNSKKLGEFSAELDHAGGTAKTQADILNQGLVKALDALGGAASEAILQIGDESKGGLVGSLTDLIKTANGVISIYEGMGDKFAESNGYTKEQYENLKNVAGELEVVAGAAGGIAALATAIWGAEAAMAAFNVVVNANPFVAVAAGIATSIGVVVARLHTLKREHEDFMKSAATVEEADAKIKQQIAKINAMPQPGTTIHNQENLKERIAAAKADLEILVEQRNALEDKAKATDTVTAASAKAIKETNSWLAEIESADRAVSEKTKKGQEEAEAAAKKLATAEENRRESVQATIGSLQFELEVNRLGDKEKALQVELREKLAKAVGGERTEIEKLVRQKHAEAAVDARKKELGKLHDDAQYAQQLANMAKELHLAGLTNAEISKRIAYEKEVAAALEAHPDLEPEKVKGYVKAQQDAVAELAQYTDEKADESAKFLEKTYQRAIENIQDDFGDMFENMLNGDALSSVEKFADNIKRTLNNAISQQLAADLQSLFIGQISKTLLSSVALYGVSLISTLFGKSAPVRQSSPSEVGRSTVLGTGAMHIADSFSRDQGLAFQTRTALEFNKNLEKLTGMISSNLDNIGTFISSIGTKLASFSVVQTVAGFFKPVTDFIGQGLGYISTIYNGVRSLIEGGVTALTNFIGLTTKATAVVTAADHAVLNAASASSEGLTPGVGSSGMSAAGNIAVVLAVIKFGYDVFSAWTDSNLDLTNKLVKTTYALSDGMLAVGMANFWNPVGWGLMIAAAITNVVGAVTDIFHNGANVQNIARLVAGPLGEAIVGLFVKTRVPNVWMNTYNPNQSGAPLQDYSYNGTYTATGNKSAYVGEYTPFGVTVVSTHEMSLSAQEMVNSFGGLLRTVKTVDITLYNTVNRLDQAMGETGKTMAYYNNLVRSYNGNEVGVKTRQDASALDIGQMLNIRYSWIVDRLAESGSTVGKYINAWFDVVTDKFVSASKDNAMFVLGVVNSLSNNIESFMQFPLELVNLIGASVKSVRAGGTPDSVMTEIMGVLNTYQTVKAGFAQMNLAVDENRIVSFLSHINALGYGVQDAGINLLAYGIALKQTNDAIIASGNALMNAVEAKFNQLKSQGFDNNQITAYFGSFGLFSNLFAEAKVVFTQSDLDVAAQHIHKLAQSSVEVARNVIDHAIADEKLTHVSRESAIATLVKAGKIEEATVAEAEYGVSIQTVTKNVLEQMGFVQQLGYVTGKTLGEMNISAQTWQAAAKNVTSVFGDMAEAMRTLDDLAKSFLTSGEYQRYNLDTLNRAMANMRASNPALSALNAQTVTQMLKSGQTMAEFITLMAKGDGELAKQELEYIKLIQQKMQVKKDILQAEKDMLQHEKDIFYGELDAAMTMLSKSVAAEKERINAKHQADQAALKNQLEATLKANATQKQAASELLSSLTSTANNLKNALKSTVVDSDQFTQLRRTAAQDLLQTALDKAKAGQSLNNYPGLEQALGDIAKPAMQFFSTAEDYAVDQGRTAQLISQLSGYADSQVSVAQQTVNAIESAADAAQTYYDAQSTLLTESFDDSNARLDGLLKHGQDQVDLLKGLDITVASVAMAIAGLNSASAKASNGWYLAAGGAVINETAGTFFNAGNGNTVAIEAKRKFFEDLLLSSGYAAVYDRARFSGLDATGLDRLMNWAPGTANKKAADRKLPSFDVGTNSVPFDMIAQIHAEERIIPPADNRELMRRLEEPAAGDRLITELKEEYSGLRKALADQQDSLNRIADSARKTAEALDGSVPVLVEIG
jgi:TP901 family phage tail tape measure protein